MVLLYFSSAVAHGLPSGKSKQVFFIIDQIAIFLLIAGTYTPLALIALHGTFGWVLFGLQWGMAITGIILKLVKPNKLEAGVDIFGIVIYALMGWMVLIAIVPLIKTLPFMALLWILIGGLCYTFGIIFYSKAKFKYAHLVWHMMVLAGSISHFFAIYFYIIPISL